MILLTEIVLLAEHLLASADRAVDLEATFIAWTVRCNCSMLRNFLCAVYQIHVVVKLLMDDGVFNLDMVATNTAAELSVPGRS